MNCNRMITTTPVKTMNNRSGIIDVIVPVFVQSNIGENVLWITRQVVFNIFLNANVYSSYHVEMSHF